MSVISSIAFKISTVVVFEFYGVANITDNCTSAVKSFHLYGRFIGGTRN